MPLYKYECPECGHQFELKQRFDAPTKMDCPKCKGEAQRKIQPVNFSFGWRLTEKSYEKYQPQKLEPNI